MKILSSYGEAKAFFGNEGDWNSSSSDNLSLIRSLELIFNNGGSTVFAVRITSSTSKVATIELKKGSSKFLGLESKTKGTYGNSISSEIVVADVEKKLILTDSKTSEKYSITTIKELVNEVNDKSQLVTATFSKEVDPDAIAVKNLSGGANGEKVNSTNYKKGLELLENDIINIVLLAGQDSSSADLFSAHLNRTAENKRERIAVVGAAEGKATNHNLNNERTGQTHHIFIESSIKCAFCSENNP